MDILHAMRMIERQIENLRRISRRTQTWPWPERAAIRRLLRKAEIELVDLFDLMREAKEKPLASLDDPQGPFVGLADNQDDLIPEIPPHNGEGKEGDHGPL